MRTLFEIVNENPLGFDENEVIEVINDFIKKYDLAENTDKAELAYDLNRNFFGEIDKAIPDYFSSELSAEQRDLSLGIISLYRVMEDYVRESFKEDLDAHYELTKKIGDPFAPSPEFLRERERKMVEIATANGLKSYVYRETNDDLRDGIYKIDENGELEEFYLSCRDFRTTDGPPELIKALYQFRTQVDNGAAVVKNLNKELVDHMYYIAGQVLKVGYADHRTNK